MKTLQNPFSFYDFLGYLIPGVLFVIGFLAVKDINIVIADPAKYLSQSFTGISIEVYLPALVVCYFLGHFLSYLSSMSIEKYSIWSIGYPSRYLLNADAPSYFNFQHKNSSYQNVLVIIKRVLLWVVLFPITFLDLIIGKVFNFRESIRKTLDNHLISEINHHIDTAFPRHSKERENDFFRLIYHCTLEKCPIHATKMQNYVALYGFTRTVALIFVVLFWIAVYLLVRSVIGPRIFFAATGTVSVISYILYADFNKFYRKFSLEAFMALCSSTKNNKRT